MCFLDIAGKTEYVYARIKESSRHALEVFYSFFLIYSHFKLLFFVLDSEFFLTKSIQNGSVVFVS